MENLDVIVLATFAVTAIICANIWLNKKMTLEVKDWKDLTGWLCDNCLSSNIYKLPVMDEMDIFCRDCNSKNYKVSEWYINRIKKETI
jgi:hypothetical protein